MRYWDDHDHVHACINVYVQSIDIVNKQVQDTNEQISF